LQAQCSRELGQPGSLGALPPGCLADGTWRANPGLAPFVTACALPAAIGDAKRFPSSRQLVSYLGLDPRVRQSGSEPARHGRISKQGRGETRHVLVEAAWHAARTTGPLRAFHERIAVRRGRNIATVAVARKRRPGSA
jgi:transposase